MTYCYFLKRKFTVQPKIPRHNNTEIMSHRVYNIIPARIMPPIHRKRAQPESPPPPPPERCTLTCSLPLAHTCRVFLIRFLLKNRSFLQKLRGADMPSAICTTSYWRLVGQGSLNGTISLLYCRQVRKLCSTPCRSDLLWKVCISWPTPSWRSSNSSG